ncbi:MAG: hypothetical protein ACFFE5_04335 [Candidatus Thorarchaeota archaeon]
MNERYSQLYRNLYEIDKDDVDRASFIICFIIFDISILLSIMIINLNILIIFLYSAILSFFFSYKFNIVIFQDINKKEMEINAMLHLIKIDFSLIKKTLKPNSDLYLSFITLIKEYKLPILDQFKRILVNIHKGKIAEKELMKILTPSRDFDSYLKNLLINNFDESYSFDNLTETKLEKNFKIYLKEIQTKISIIFFIGIFFPIGLCFLILFRLINIFSLIVLIPLFLIMLNLFCRKFVRKNLYLIGVLNDYSGLEKKKFNEFLLFLSGFAVNLKNNLSPERAFLKSYTQNKNFFLVLDRTFKNQLTRLLNFNCSFFDMIQFFKLELSSIRYSVILDLIEKFVSENPYYSTEKIFDVLTVLSTHQKLENKLEIILKGEKFKIFFFIFLLPILIGAISGMFPFFNLITNDINMLSPVNLIDYSKLMNFYYTILIFVVFTSTISITSNYFLEIIKYKKKFLIIIISNLIFILTFLSSFINVLSVI